jgi:hypothetical protein
MRFVASLLNECRGAAIRGKDNAEDACAYFGGDVAMTTRTIQTVALFSSPFRLPGMSVPQPAGEYRVDQDEELIETSSRLVWHRTATFLHLPAVGVDASTHQMVPVAPADLDAALQNDRKQP